MKVTVTSPECHDPYQITDGCSVSASSSLDDTTLPANVLANDDTYWAPAIRSDKYIEYYTNSKLDSHETFQSFRSGPNWSHYISFNLRLKFRLTRLNILGGDSSTITYR